MVEPTPAGPSRRRRFVRGVSRGVLRVLRVVGLVLVGLIAVVVLVIGLPPTRGWLLRTGLGVADRQLPGELAYGRAAWPGLGRLEIDGLLWTAGDDTLASLARARLQFQVSPLLRGEVVVDSVRVDRGHVDLGRLRAAMPADTTVALADTAARKPLPNAALRSLVVRDLTLITPTGSTVHLPAADGALELRPEHDRGGSLSLQAIFARGIATGWRAEGRWDDGVVLDFSPLPVIYSDTAPDPAALPLSGHMRISASSLDALMSGGGGELPWPQLTLTGLAVTGDLGRAAIDADLTSSEHGRIDALVDLTRPPAPLAQDLAALAPDTLRERLAWLLTEGWPARDPHLELHAVVTPPPPGGAMQAARVEGEASFVLPGPADLGAMLPDTLQTDDLGAIAGRLAGAYDGRVQPPAYHVDLDLTETSWLRAGRVRAHGAGRQVVIEELALAMKGLDLTASGSFDTTAVDVEAHVVVPDLSLVRRWPNLVPAGARGHARLDLAARGALPLPEATVDLEASYDAPQMKIPAVRLNGEHVGRRLRVNLDLPQGAELRAQRLDRAALDLTGDLAGYPDSAQANVRLSAAADTTAFDIAAALDLAGLDQGVPAVSARLDTMRLRRGARAVALANPCLVAFDPRDSSVTIEDMRIDGRLGHVIADARVRRDSLDVNLDIDVTAPLDELRPFLPPAQQANLPHGTTHLGAQLVLQGSPMSPRGHARVDLVLRDVPKRPPVALAGEVWLLDGSTPAAGSPAGALPADAPAHGLAADLRLAVDSKPLLDVVARLPAAITLQPAGFKPLDAPARVEVRGEAIELSDLGGVMPPDLAATGRLAIALTATGQAQDLALDGSLSARDVRVALADGSWFSAKGDVTAAGTVKAPDLQGAITIDQGLIKVPETPPTLLPAEGDALLWAGHIVADSLAVEADTMAVKRQAAADSVAAAATAKAAVHLVCPGSLWLRGRGLDIELEGDIWIRQAGTTTTVSGDLDGVRGTLSLLGRTFTLERGQVMMEGDVRELAPQLDISLRTELAGGTYWVKLTGTPTNMDLELTSDPEMSEGDIMATLIFGKPLDDLDEGQTDLVAQRSAEIAAAYGAGRLQALIADQLGLDMVRIDPHTEDAGATTLTVGKYLSPKLMVSYEQTLEAVSTFVVHLEYLIRGGFKVHSAVSPGQQSGAELLWSRDY